jgi:hypothetical protein
MSNRDMNWALFCGSTLLQVLSIAADDMHTNDSCIPRLRIGRGERTIMAYRLVVGRLPPSPPPPRCQIVRDHSTRLPADLVTSMVGAINDSARATVRRGVSPSYTNVAIIGSYLVLVRPLEPILVTRCLVQLRSISAAVHLDQVTGETLQDAALVRNGLRMLGKFYNFTTTTGGFQEYNSPPYMGSAIIELTRLRTQARDPTAVAMASDLLTRLWTELGEHFHPPTAQWTGPFSRTYSTLLRRSTLGMIQRGTNRTVTFPNVDDVDREERWVTHGGARFIPQPE